MPDASSHESADEPITQRSARAKNAPVRRAIIRVAVGACGAIFVGLVYLGGLSLRHSVPNPTTLVMTGIAGGIVIGWLAFSRDVRLRVIAWVPAALGAGCLLSEISPQWIADADFEIFGTYISSDDIVNMIAGIFGVICGVYARPKSIT